MVTEKQMQIRLEKYYIKHYGERDTDEWHINPAPNKWRFDRDGKTITLVCSIITGVVYAL